MFLENVIFDAVEPRRLGRFWETVLGGEQLTDEAAGYETRVAVDDGPVLDLGFQKVGELPAGPSRLHFELLGEASRSDTVQRLLRLGARQPNDDRDDGSLAVLADPQGNPFRVIEERAAYAGTGPLAVIALESADPERDVEFWAWLTGWTRAEEIATGALRHASQRGPLLELRPEQRPKGQVKNCLHLDIRLEAGDVPDEVAAGVTERGGRELHLDWGDLPWRHFADPSGNEFCALPASPH